VGRMTMKKPDGGEASPPAARARSWAMDDGECSASLEQHRAGLYSSAFHGAHPQHVNQ